MSCMNMQDVNKGVADDWFGHDSEAVGGNRRRKPVYQQDDRRRHSFERLARLRIHRQRTFVDDDADRLRSGRRSCGLLKPRVRIDRKALHFERELK